MKKLEYYKALSIRVVGAAKFKREKKGRSVWHEILEGY